MTNPLASFQCGARVYTPVPDVVILEAIAALRAAMARDPKAPAAAAAVFGALAAYTPEGTTP